MLRLINTSIMDKTQVAAEVTKALEENTLIVITKEKAKNANPVYAVYGAPQGRLIAGQIVH